MLSASPTLLPNSHISTQGKLSLFLVWLANNEINVASPKTEFLISPKLDINYIENVGFGIYYNAEVGLSPKEQLLKIPKSLLINYLTCLKHILEWNRVTRGTAKGASLKIFESAAYKNIIIPERYYEQQIEILAPSSHGSGSDWYVDLVYKRLTPAQLLELSSFQLVGLFLSIESLRKEGSFWYKFLEVLPQGLESFKGIPLTWEFISNKELDSLSNDLRRRLSAGLDKINMFRAIGEDYGAQEISNSENEHVQFESLLIATLPFYVQIEVKKQYYRFIKDYNSVMTLLDRATASPNHKQTLSTAWLTKPTFLWSWLCINSRCLYMSLPNFLCGKTSADNFTLCPLVDFINHCDNSNNESCDININQSCFQVFAPAGGLSPETPGSGLDPAKKREVLFSYGSHPNAFLLVEYGFVLSDSNQWEILDITEQVEKRLDKTQKQFLQDNGYSGDFTLDYESISFRTTVALSLLNNCERCKINSTDTTQITDFKQGSCRKIILLINGTIDESTFQESNNLLLKQILVERLAQTQASISMLNSILDKVSFLKNPVSSVVNLHRYQLTLFERWIQKL